MAGPSFTHEASPTIRRSHLQFIHIPVFHPVRVSRLVSNNVLLLPTSPSTSSITLNLTIPSSHIPRIILHLSSASHIPAPPINQTRLPRSETEATFETIIQPAVWPIQTLEHSESLITPRLENKFRHHTQYKKKRKTNWLAETASWSSNSTRKEKRRAFKSNEALCCTLFSSLLPSHPSDTVS